MIGPSGPTNRWQRILSRGGAWLALALAMIGLTGCATGYKSAPAQRFRSPSTSTSVETGPASEVRKNATPEATGGDLFPHTKEWQPLFDSRTLKGWKPTDFAGRGEVRVDNGTIQLEMGYMTGITWTNDIPRMNYEVQLDAMRVDGSDFFCGLTFPVGLDSCSLIVGGWGGGVVGLSSLDGEDAAHNDTTRYMNFEKGRWYHIRLLVTLQAIQAWIDEEKVVDVNPQGRAISIRVEVESSKPFGIATWSTAAALRNLRLRRL